MSPDPLAGDIGNPQSLNRYAYVLNTPETFIDSLGMDTSSSNRSTTDSCSVHVTATPVCYGPPQIGDPFAGFWGYVPYYGETACLLMQEQMGAGGAALFDTPTSNPGLPAITYTYGGRLLPNGPRSSQTQGPPYVCSGTAQFLNSLDFTTKLGLDAELSKALVVQADLFKNNQTGEKGAELGLGLAFFGVQLQRVVPAGADITSDAGSDVLTVNLGPFQYSSQTGLGLIPLSSLAHFGGAVLVGGEVSFDSQRAGQISAQCGGQP